MKKSLLTLVALLTLGTAVSAQFYHYSYTPWNGSSAYSLNVGTHLDMNDSGFGFSTKHLPLAASLRHDAEKDINENFSWGYQAEVSYFRYGYDYEELYDTYSGQTVIGSRDVWDFQLDVRLMLGYYFTDNFELAAGAGLYYDVIRGHIDNSYRIDNVTGAEVPDSRHTGKHMDPFSSNMGFSFFLGANYYLNDDLFLTLSLRDQIGIDFFELDEDVTSKNTAVVLLGIGFKL